jgi:alpha-aminoadipic semialdehyde synthase
MACSPHLYRPVFHERIAPYLTALVNCMYWESRFPRLLTIEV